VVDVKKLKIHMSSSPGMVADPATIDPGLTAEQWWAQATEMMKEMNVLMGPGVLETEICIGGPETAHLSRAVAEALYAAGYNTPMAIMEMADADMVLDLQDAGVRISRMQNRTIAAALRTMYTVVVYKGFMEALRQLGEQEGQGAATGESEVAAFQLQPPREACTPMGSAGGSATTGSQGTDQSGGIRKAR